MTPGQRLGLWIALCLAGGAACAFLTLEGAGIPYALAFLGGMIFISERFHLVAESLAAFGLSFTLVAAHFVFSNIAVFASSSDFASSLFFGLVPVIGVGFIVTAALVRRPDRWFRR